MNSPVILLLTLYACVEASKNFDFNCSSFSMKYLNGKRVDIHRPADVICKKSCRTVMERDKEDKSLKIWSGCGDINASDSDKCVGHTLDDAVHCDCIGMHCNNVATDDDAVKFEKHFLEHMGDRDAPRYVIKETTETIKCHAFELVYNSHEGSKKITSHPKPKSEITCKGTNCHTWMLEKSQFETTIHGGCGELIDEGTRCEKFYNTRVECACSGEFCNDVKDADEAEGYYETWNDHFPAGPYPRSGSN